MTKSNWSRYAYLAFLILGLMQIGLDRDYLQAAVFLGIALAFDPFDQQQPWSERPRWQRAVLVVHLGAVAALFGLGLGLADRLLA